MNDKTFSKQKGIDVQTNQLTRWESILKPDCYLLLKNWARSTNNVAKSGYDIVRGTDLDNWIHNNLMK